MPTTQPITTCPDGAGSINNPDNPSGLPPIAPYTPPDLCIGEFTLSDPNCIDAETAFQEQLAAENLNISGAPLNIFKLLGIHEQGKLVDLTGEGRALGSGTPQNAFDTLVDDWVSDETGLDVVTYPTYLGYDFGYRLTSFGQQETEPPALEMQHITSFRITQGSNPQNRALQVRIERSDGGYKIDPLKINFTGTGNGTIKDFVAGVRSIPGMLMISALNATQFMVAFISESGTQVLGMATVNVRFNSVFGSLTITQGTNAYSNGDTFTAQIELEWWRVDVVNLPNMDAPALIRIKQSRPSRYWRIVPISFAGATSNQPWVVKRLELFDFQATRLDDIQDHLFLENRDRDYANASIQLKVSYTPVESISDLSKFGFQIADVYTFNTHFGTMVQKLGRPIVVGDVIELPAEMQYDHNLKPVRKFLEVTDVAWASEGYTTTWKPTIYRFSAQHLIPGQEHRDLLGTIDTQKYVVDDGSFFEGIEQIQTAPLTTTERVQAEAVQAVPEKGTNTREWADGTNQHGLPGSYGGVGTYVEDGLPPDGAPYTSGFKLPDVAGQIDGNWFRLEYDPKTNIPARLYKFTTMKNKWIYVETDRRSERNSHKPSQQTIFDLQNKRSLASKL